MEQSGSSVESKSKGVFAKVCAIDSMGGLFSDQSKALLLLSDARKNGADPNLRLYSKGLSIASQVAHKSPRDSYPELLAAGAAPVEVLRGELWKWVRNMRAEKCCESVSWLLGLIDGQTVKTDHPMLLSALDKRRACCRNVILRHGDAQSRESKKTLGIAFAEAINKQDVASMRELLEMGASVFDRFGKYKNTPIHTAVYYGRMTSVRFLLANGADVNSKNSLGETPLLSAICISCGIDARMVLLLLENGADANMADHRGRSPLYWALAMGNLGMASVLLDFGANPEARSGINGRGRSPVLLAQKGSEDGARKKALPKMDQVVLSRVCATAGEPSEPSAGSSSL